MIKFSVLTSIYRSEKFLDSYFQTIFDQIVLPDEIIIIDDTKNPVNIDQIIEKQKVKYNFSNIKLYKNNMNKGPAISLNFGLKQCSNDLIFRLDVDDIWHKDHTKKMIEMYLKNKDYLIYANSLKKKNFLTDLKCDDYFINENHLIHSSWLINRKIFKNFKYHMVTPSVALEDYFTMLYFIRKKYKIYFDYNLTTKYTYSEGSHGRNYKKDFRYIKTRKLISKYFLIHYLKNKSIYKMLKFLFFQFGIFKLAVFTFWIQDLIHLRKLTKGN